MSIILIIVNNITVLVSQNIIFFRFLSLWAMVSIIRLLQVSSPTLLSPTRFSQGLFVWQKIFDQLSIAVIRLFAKNNAFYKKIGFFFLSSLLVNFGFAGLFMFLECFLQFFYYEMTNVFLVSKETKFEVDTTSIILSYLYHFRNVEKELFRYCLSPVYQTMQKNAMWQKLVKFLFYKITHVKKIRRQWNVNHIYSNKNYEITNICTEWRNKFKRKIYYPGRIFETTDRLPQI